MPEDNKKDMASWKPGSEAEQAKDVKAPGDFGVPVGSGPTRERDYVSENTKMSDPGAAKPHSFEHEGVRTSGTGSVVEGTGSGSEGDIDTDILGVGTGASGISASGPGDQPGADDTDGSSAEFASGKPARGENQEGVGQIGGAPRVQGSTVFGDVDIQTGPEGQGADAATNPTARGDDSFAGEISTHEAEGQDLSMGPSQETQGLSEEDNQESPKDPRGES